MIEALQTIALVVLAAAQAALRRSWCAVVAPADHDEDAETDRAALDSIRAELERQEAPARPHIRGLS